MAILLNDLCIPVIIYGETKSLGFEKGDGFYETHLDELPDGELFFRLCSVENPIMYAPPLGCGKRRIN